MVGLRKTPCPRLDDVLDSSCDGPLDTVAFHPTTRGENSRPKPKSCAGIAFAAAKEGQTIGIVTAGRQSVGTITACQTTIGTVTARGQRQASATSIQRLQEARNKNIALRAKLPIIRKGDKLPAQPQQDNKVSHISTLSI